MSCRKPRSRPISLAEFRRLISAERKVAEALGFTIRIRYRKFNWQRVRDYGVYSNVSGFFCEKRHLIQLTVTGRPSRTQVISALYHEMRHLEHYVLGFFSDYYRLTPDIVGMIVDKNRVPEGFVAPCLRTAVLAERDCDRISARRMRKLGLSFTIKPYPLHNTLSYVVITSLEAIYEHLVETEPFSTETVGLRQILEDFVSKTDKTLIKLKSYKGSNSASYHETEAITDHIRDVIKSKEIEDGTDQ